MGSRICQPVPVLYYFSLPPPLQIQCLAHGRCSVKVCFIKRYGRRRVLPHPSYLQPQVLPGTPIAQISLLVAPPSITTDIQCFLPPKSTRCLFHLPSCSSLGTPVGVRSLAGFLVGKQTMASRWVGLVGQTLPAPHLPTPSQGWFYLVSSKKKQAPRGRGSLEVSTSPSLTPSAPWLT